MGERHEQYLSAKPPLYMNHDLLAHWQTRANQIAPFLAASNQSNSFFLAARIVTSAAVLNL